MWTRRLSRSMDQEEFIKCFISALGNEQVLQKMRHNICGDLQKEIGELRDLLQKREQRIETLEKRIEELERRQDESEQYSRRNSLRISGVDQNENEDVTEKVLSLFNNTMKLSPPVSMEHIDRVHRVGPVKPGKSRPILVKFSMYRTRNSIFRAKKILKEVNQASNKNIYVNEDLTKFRSTLLYKAREMKRQKMITDCWSWDGTILIKDNVNKIIPIRTIADLQEAAG